MLYNSIEETIGNTPLVRLSRIEKHFGLDSRLYAKLEFFNPGGSIKDRPAMNMIDEAYEKGLISKGWTIIEPTSGNTGIGLALAACKYNLKVILVMPENATKERIALMKALGAEVVLTPSEKGIKGAIAKASEILASSEKIYMPMQFENPANPRAHEKSTAKEIIRDLGKEPDIFVACSGTGGTITGNGRYFKERKYKTRIITIEPKESTVLSGGKPAKHGIAGMGPGFIPPVIDLDLVDEIAQVSTEDAREFTLMLSGIEKIFCGVSAGAALKVAVDFAVKEKNLDIVFIVPDSSERYISTGLFG